MIRHKTYWGGNINKDGAVDVSTNWVNNNVAWNLNIYKIGTNSWTSGNVTIDGVDMGFKGGWVARASKGPGADEHRNNSGNYVPCGISGSMWAPGDMSPHHIQIFAMGCCEFDAG